MVIFETRAATGFHRQVARIRFDRGDRRSEMLRFAAKEIESMAPNTARDEGGG
jgi:hypothetical protein